MKLHQDKIDSEILKENAKGEKAKKNSAILMYAELFAVIRDCLKVASGKARPAGLPVADSPHAYISHMMDSIEPNEVIAIFKIYQNIEKLKIVYLKFDEHNAFDHSTRDCNNFLSAIFGDRVVGLKQLNSEALHEDTVIGLMPQEYRDLFVKLIQLKSAI
jgi:hypothetical protein